MLRKLYKWNKYTVVSLLVLSLICSLLISPSSNAAPGYDDDYQSIQSIQTGASGYYGINCDATNISSIWQTYIIDPSTWYNPSDATNPSSWNYQAKASFETALVSGRWGVSQRVEYGSGGWFKSILVFWTEDPSLSLNWHSDGIDVNGAGNNVHYLAIGCRKVVQGNGGSEPIAWAYSQTGGLRVSNDKPFNDAPTNSAEAGGIANLFISTDHPNYPSVYEGDLIVSNYQGGIITGNVQCANSSNIISTIGVNVQSGLDGNAAITDDGMGGKNYRFYLWEESPYSLIVICDGDPFYGPSVNSDLYDYYYWVCTATGGLNVCAAS